MFRTVHGAGHMVPSTQPERASVLIKEFLNKNEDDKRNNLIYEWLVVKKLEWFKYKFIVIYHLYEY